MSRYPREMSIAAWVGVALVAVSTGCGTTRTSNTQRTATEQLLISDAIDRAVQEINFSALAGKSVYFEERHLYDVVDDSYLISSMRQHLLACGCILKSERNDADYVIEPRAGAVGTDNEDLLFGIPATNVPQLTLLSGLPPALPEVPIAKRRKQRGVAKIAVFAYRRDTGAPVWQSGIVTNQSTSNDIWILGAGPFKRGTIHRGTSLAGGKMTRQEADDSSASPNPNSPNMVARLDQEANFQHQPLPAAIPVGPVPGTVQQAAAIEASYVDGAPVFPPPSGPPATTP